MSVSSPRVSIGLPVFNGERYLAHAIDSILAQTYTDFELIISDNGSTDGTECICKEYASRDHRIRYLRSQENRGAAWNFRHVFERASGEYFKWMAHDDICDPRFLELCVETLDRLPEVLLCCCKTHMIDEKGAALPDYDPIVDTYVADPCKRFLNLLRVHNYYFQVQGLMRRRTLESTKLISGFVSSDIVLLAELTLAGRFYERPEYLFSCRIHSRQSVQMSRYLRAAWFDPAKAGRLTFPQWRLFGELFRCVGRAQMVAGKRARCYSYVLRWPLWNMNWARMAKDLLVASIQLLGRARRVAQGKKGEPASSYVAGYK